MRAVITTSVTIEAERWDAKKSLVFFLLLIIANNNKDESWGKNWNTEAYKCQFLWLLLNTKRELEVHRRKNRRHPRRPKKLIYNCQVIAIVLRFLFRHKIWIPLHVVASILKMHVMFCVVRYRLCSDSSCIKCVMFMIVKFPMSFSFVKMFPPYPMRRCGQVKTSLHFAVICFCDFLRFCLSGQLSHENYSYLALKPVELSYQRLIIFLPKT